MKKIFIISLLVLVTGTAFGSAAVQAQYTPLEPLPCIPGQGLDCSQYGGDGQPISSVQFKTYVQYMFNLIIALGAAGAVFMMIYGGLVYMTSEAIPMKEDGIKKVKNALFGLLLILTSYLILRTVDPRLVAIPTTLVPQLKVEQPKNLSSLLDLFDINADQINELSKIAGASQETYKEAVKNIEEAKTEYNKLSSQLSILDQEIIALTKALGYPSASAQEICANTSLTSMNQTLKTKCLERAKLLDQQDDQTYIVKTQATIANIEKEFRKCIENITVAIDVRSCKAKVAAAASAGLNSVSGNYPEGVTEINDYVSYANTYIDLSKEYQLKKTLTAFITQEDYGAMIFNVQKQIDLIETPYIKEKLIAARNSIMTSLGAKQALIDDGTYLKAFKH